MLRRTINFFVKVTERWMPDPLVIAIFLTAVALAAALLFTDFTASQSVEAWGNSYWSLLRFTAQMILILALVMCWQAHARCGGCWSRWRAGFDRLIWLTSG